MADDRKRIIELNASTEIFDDDWLVKDSPTQDTSKMLASAFKAWVLEGVDFDALESMIASEFVPLQTYYNGSYVIHEDKLYVNNNGGIILASEFNTSQWTEVTITDVFKKFATDFAPLWASNGEYVKDDIVIRGNQLYICTVDTATSGSFITSEWTTSDVATIIDTKITNAISEEAEAREQADAELDEKISANTMLGTASGDIASFNDGADDLPMKSLKVSIEPQQDLHGYDHPWAGGAGKNKLKVTGTSQTINDVTFTVKDDGTIKVNGTATADVKFVIGEYILKAGSSVRLNGSPVDGSASTIALGYQGYGIASTANSDRVCDRTSASTDWDNDVYISVTSGYTANNLTFKPMIRLASVTDGTFAPYSNICPIIGWDEAVVGVSGVNQWDENWRIDQNQFKAQNLIPVMPNTTYYFKCPVDVLSAFNYDKNKNVLGILTIDKNSIFTTGSDVYFIWFSLPTNTYGTTYNNDISINYPSTDTSYHAYNGATYTIDLDGTRYGGELDVVSGVLTVDRANVDLGTLNWSYSTADVRFFTTSIKDIKKVMDTTTVMNGLCSHYDIVAYTYVHKSTALDGIMGLYSTSTTNYLAIKDTQYTDATAFKTAMNGVQLVYELATPQTIQLTPTQVKSLLGSNNIWANTGEVINAEYVRDATSTINDILARLKALEEA